MSDISHRLARMELFKTPTRDLSEDEQLILGYEHARASAQEFGLTIDDIIHLTPKFWNYHQELIHTIAMPAFVLVTIQYNLVAGTIGRYITKRPDLWGLLNSIVKFEVSAQFLLTEIGHGLDAKNLETTATMLPDGGFDLHSPTMRAAKFMPPTTPIPNFPKVAVVFARLIVSGDDHGIRPFIVWLNDGNEMSKGVTSRRLPNRTGSSPLDHSVTTFDHVKLPASALLGSVKKPTNMRDQFLHLIQRVAVGTLALSTVLIPTMKRAVNVAGTYSMRRSIQVNDKNAEPTPIISFRTQQRPILHTLAQIAVFEPLIQVAIDTFMEYIPEPAIQSAIATIVKAVLVSSSQRSLFELSERCGAQGLFGYNHIIQNQLEARGISIAEGDIQVLSIRLAAELLLGRYEIPPAQDETSLLARHEAGLFDECRMALMNIKGHRNVEFNNAILLGHRMAFEAASNAGIDPDLLALYEAGVILQDSSWYVQYPGITREEQFERESRALSACLPKLEQLLDGTGAKEFVTAPILSDDAWAEFLSELKTFEPASGWSNFMPRIPLRSML
ncbi:acyl-CoA dehydrogenase/oxidase [Penicillium malachiteum]|uniref:Acyl-CoA dehydrogenase/oxidase n=1 Tax=Penicillium malachiteum TaxID=1324776 RepID=A0AAD6MQZ8_9EURO|nr:acyl-CoA dehydrogenase/oxidase [Penicillium malachiteum]